jgi:hypothetical protein
VRVDGFAYVNVVCAHLDGQGDFANHVAGVGWPTMSPMAKMSGTLVRIWISTLIKPRSAPVAHGAAK